MAAAPTGDRILLHLPSGTYLKLDRSASAIVDLLAEHDDVSRAAAALAARCSIPVDRAQADVATVVDALGGLRATRTSPMRRPALTGVWDTLRQWWALPLRLQVAVAEAVVVVVAVEVGLRTTDVGTLAQRMQVPLASGMADPPEDDADDISVLTPGEQRMYWATGWVLNRWVFPDTCLRRALAAGFVLRRNHPVLQLGLVGDGETTHAWVEAKGMTFNATEVTGRFVASTGPAA